MNDKKLIRTRYAPSPTGYLHIGGARTALMSYLLAKHHDGKFIIRIEDTDIERNIQDGEKSQIENLEWLGIIADESPLNPNPKYGPYRQSEKLNRYKQIIKILLDKKLAYYAYDSKEELIKQKNEQFEKGIHSFRYDKKWLKISETEKRKRKDNGNFSIRFKVDPNTFYHWNDIVRGKITVKGSDIGDFIIQKQNQYPTYNFAVVVDDYDMQITHVLRGEEHITNTPKQLALYQALNWDIPQFGHLTIITNFEGKKLSKRDKTIKQFISDYKKIGYHHDGIFNFLSLLGWTSEDKKEIMTHQEIIEKFTTKRLSKSSSKFDANKMAWFSKQKINLMSNIDIIKKLNFENYDKEWINIFIETYKKSSITFLDFKKEILKFEKKEIKTFIPSKVIDTFIEFLKSKDFSINNIQEAINQTSKICNVKGKDLFLPIRLATTYANYGPELAKAIWLFGKKTIYQRLNIY